MHPASFSWALITTASWQRGVAASTAIKWVEHWERTGDRQLLGRRQGPVDSRPFTIDEDALPAWGERIGDLYIADAVYFANVPEPICRYELGGYPVLKKWLGYGQPNRRDDVPLTAEERRWFKSMVQRVAELLALSAQLDELYSAASENAFSAVELGIER